MRAIAKQMHNQLDWSVLDIEPEEWDRRMAALGVAADASGVPVYAAAQAGTNGQDSGPTDDNLHPLRIGRFFLRIAAAVLVLAALVSYVLWHKAQEGIVLIQGDVANVVKLETVKTRHKQPALHLCESVDSVELLGDKAMAAVVVTRTLSSGEQLIHVETRFYQQTAHGWQRTAPLAAFWGPTATLDTASLHFVFGEKDRAVIEQVAPAAESLYTTLRRATGENLAANGRLAVEIVQGYVALNAQFEDGRIQLTSPLLHRVTPLSAATSLGLQLRQVLINQMLLAALSRTAVKGQWLSMAHGYSSWLMLSEAIQPASDSELVALRRLRLLEYPPLHLDKLQDNLVYYDSVAPSVENYYRPGPSYDQEQRMAGAEQLVGFIAATYGIDALPKLLHGFARYDDWETLAPAVLGVSAAELEAAWHSAWQQPQKHESSRISVHRSLTLPALSCALLQAKIRDDSCRLTFTCASPQTRPAPGAASARRSPATHSARAGRACRSAPAGAGRWAWQSAPPRRACG